MLKLYDQRHRLLINGEEFGSWHYGTFLYDTTEAEDYTVKDKDWSWLYQHSRLFHNTLYNVKKSKKGYSLVHYMEFGYIFASWKKKYKDFKFTLEVTYKECNQPIEFILKYPDCDKAIQYLKERGMTMCPMGGK